MVRIYWCGLSKVRIFLLHIKAVSIPPTRFGGKATLNKHAISSITKTHWMSSVNMDVVCATSISFP